MNIKKDLFNIFRKNQDLYSLYEETINYIEKAIYETKGKENVEFYGFANQLLNSINNAGCEERRSQQIDLLRDIQNNIADKYDEFLF